MKKAGISIVQIYERVGYDLSFRFVKSPKRASWRILYYMAMKKSRKRRSGFAICSKIQYEGI